MSKKNLDEFLCKKTKSPLNTDVIYGGNATRHCCHSVETVTETVTVHSVSVSVKVTVKSLS